MVNRYLIVFILTLCSVSQAFGKVVAVVSQNPAYIHQPFTLEVSVDENLSAKAFDSSALLREGFIVSNTATNRQFSSINGHSETQTRWVTTLVAKEAGDYLIPSMPVGDGHSDPIYLTVLDIPQVAQEQQEVKLEVSLSQATAYVGESVTYTAKILVGSELSQPNLQSPHADDSNIQQLGDDKQDLEVINGKRYRTLTRKWLITPNEEGDITIEGAKLSGRIQIAGQIQSVLVTGEDQELESKPIPSNFPGEWLASQDLLLSETLEPEQNSYTQGEAFTRTLTLTIAGITEDQLPNITVNYGDAFRVYPDQVEDRTIVKEGLVFAQRIIRLALVPNEHGTFTLPSVELPWWDLTQDKLSWARVPEREIQVTPAHSTPTVIPTSQSESKANDSTTNLGFLFAILWIMTLIGWGIHIRYLRKQNTQITKQPIIESPTQAPWTRFEVAANANQLQQADAAFSHWAWQQPIISPEMKRLMDELSQLTWSKQPDYQWDGKEFLTRVKKAEAKHNKDQTADELPDLNPW